MVVWNKLAEIQYVGLPGISEACVQAVQRMLQYNDHIVSAKVLTNEHDHCLLLVVDEYDQVAIKSGFASGYGGEGPRALARALQLLLDHGVELEEVEVDRAVLDRLDASALTMRDLDAIDASKTVRPSRIYEYIADAMGLVKSFGMHWDRFPTVLPFAIIDKRIADLALGFLKNPNETLLRGFRRLEDTVRQRTYSQEHGQSSLLKRIKVRMRSWFGRTWSQASQLGEATFLQEPIWPIEIRGHIGRYGRTQLPC
jgi:hypothetical protein